MTSRVFNAVASAEMMCQGLVVFATEYSVQGTPAEINVKKLGSSIVFLLSINYVTKDVFYDYCPNK